MTRYIVIRIAALCLAACSAELEREREVDEQPIMQVQEAALQGVVLQGTQVQGMTMKGFRFAGATLNGAALSNLRLDKGELVAEQNQVTLRGAALVNAHLFADVQKPNVSPPQTAVVEYKITAITAENPIYDPTHTGNTFLYTLEQNVDNTGTYQPACRADTDGRRVAIPLADTWNDRGDRNSSAPLFTLACTTGAIATCYRWGYRPWVTGYGNLTILHWTCTRVARADYCGDGVPHTLDGTLINVWDNLGAPGPIQAHAPTPPGMSFEAAWGQGGAICMSHARWSLGGTVAAAACANRLRPPGPGGSVCDNVAEALMQGGANTRMFNESVIGP